MFGLQKKRKSNKIEFLNRYGIYTLITCFIIIVYFIVDKIIINPSSLLSLPIIIAHLLAILVLGGIITFFTDRINTFFQHRHDSEKEKIHARISLLREEMSREIDIQSIGRVALKALCELLEVTDAQLTLYYDQPFALEVTHIRLENNDLRTLVERLREDEPGIIVSDAEVLTPERSAETQVLIHRERLVGLLLIGAESATKEMDEGSYETLEELVQAIASGIDQVMMIRNVSETNQRLFESEKLISIGQLASGIAHEIRNPLTSIKMNLQGFGRNSDFGERDTRRKQICLDEIDRLDDIVSEVMSFARRTKLQVTPVTAKRLIFVSVDSIRGDLENRGFKVDIKIGDDLPEINVDEHRIISVLINLVLNASQMELRDKTISVVAERYGKGIEILVIDKGPGIPEKFRRDIFNPFFTTKASGTGLGLANALKFVQEHGGELDFTTEEGVGTTFSLRLPPNPPNHVVDPSAIRVMPT